MSSAEDRLLAVSPIDGRYADKISELQTISSEFGLIQRRVAVEVGWLSTLASGVLPDVAPLGDVAHDHLQTIVTDFAVSDAVDVKDLEKTTNHDVKAVEMWLRSMIAVDGAFGGLSELIHFGATSEDINNLAVGMQIRDVRDTVILPGLSQITEDLEAKADAHASTAMLARTHGQPATPTTLGKEMRVFSERLRAHSARLEHVQSFGKFNGATGGYNAMMIAYPHVNWPAVTSKFVRSLGFEVNPVTTQIEPHDWTAVLMNEVALGNTILTDLSTDIWEYISKGYFTQQTVAGEVGSSTMPHKVNPIDFENAEANFGIANGSFVHLASKLTQSRLQRDLSDSSAQRALGEAFGHTLIAQKSLKKGLGKIDIDRERIAEDLDKEWSILTEAVQTVMRRYKISGAYEAIKAVSRGKSLTRTGYQDLVESLDLPDDAKDRLRTLTPWNYIGAAPDLAQGKYSD